MPVRIVSQGYRTRIEARCDEALRKVLNGAIIARRLLDSPGRQLSHSEGNAYLEVFSQEGINQSFAYTLSLLQVNFVYRTGMLMELLVSVLEGSQK